MGKFVVDTNVVLQYPNIFRINPEDEFIIHSVVAEELDNQIHNKGRNPELAYQARKARNAIKESEDENITYSMKTPTSEIPSTWDKVKNDNIILSFAKDLHEEDRDVVLYTNDLAMQIKAGILGISTKEYNECDISLGMPKCYNVVRMGDLELCDFYTKLENKWDLKENQYLIIEDNDGKVIDKYKWTEKAGFKKLKYSTINSRQVGKVKPRNLHQELYMDMLHDKNTHVKTVCGGYGTGKDYLALAYFLDAIDRGLYDKIIWIRNNVEAQDTEPVGFLKGTLNDKLSVYAEIISDFVGDKIGFEMLINSGKLELVHAGFLRGRDFRNSIIYCTEAQNMSKSLVQLILSRVSENSVIFFNGDTEQIDSNKFKADNGLDILVRRLQGNHQFGYANLEKCERSEVADMAKLLD